MVFLSNQENLGAFPCTGCSACCRKVSEIVEQAAKSDPASITYKAALSFPYGWDSSGSCEKLKDGKCTVYDTRPLLCNVQSMSKYLSEETGVSMKNLYYLTACMCNHYIDSLKLDKRFIIDPEQFA